MKAILYDVTKCGGCLKCVQACAMAAGAPAEDLHCEVRRDELSARRRSTVVRSSSGRWVRRHCHHCMDPSCVSACLVGALTKDARGVVTYDESKCIGCRYCMLACPFGYPKYEWDRLTPLMRKCELCYDRPGGPACVQACDQGAALYGEREELLAEARRRFHARPDLYVRHIWGEREMGGTGVLFISDTDLSEFWPKQLGEHAIPEITMPFLTKAPWIAIAVAGGLSCFSWIVRRRNRLAEEHQG
jgi:formate dehydrogenase iron-sulfur subunit